ncbi:MAG: molybdenum cofactor biosynthesis protein MoaE [Pseudomonadota bacterium]
MARVSISGTPIETEALRNSMADVRAGGFVVFEGWVRNHNDGREVQRLEYEVYHPLAISEGERIITETCQRHGVIDARAVHREGLLELGDCAVWVGVAAGHRDEAFVACREIIDRIKVELPIWKKEHYVDGDSGWVNCERCAAHGHTHGHSTTS